MQAFRSERGDTAATLGLSGEQVGAMRKVIDGHRGRVDAAIRCSSPRRPTSPCRPRRDAEGPDSVYRDQLALRQAADAAYGLEAGARDKALAPRVLQTGDAVLARLERVSAALERQMGRLDPESRS